MRDFFHIMAALKQMQCEINNLRQRVDEVRDTLKELEFVHNSIHIVVPRPDDETSSESSVQSAPN